MHNGRSVTQGPRVRPAGLRRGYALAVLAALAAACSSSSGSTFPGGGGGSSSGSSNGGGGGSSSGYSLGPNLPTCPACGGEAGVGFGPDADSCPEGWMMTTSCHCFLPGMLCTDPQNDCGGVQSACAPEPTLDGAGNRCHCDCPMRPGAICWR